MESLSELPRPHNLFVMKFAICCAVLHVKCPI